MFGIGMSEMIVLGIVGLLLFGSRLPEVARSLGKGMREFKEGMAGIQNEFNSSYTATPSRSENRVASRPVPDDADEGDELVAPKFEPPPIEPAEPSQTT